MHVTHVEEERPGILDLELDDPLDDGDVEIAGQHQGFAEKTFIRVLRAYARLGRAKTKLFLELPLDGNLDDRLHEGYEKVQAWAGHTVEPAELEHDAGLIGLDLIDGAIERYNGDEPENDSSEPLG